MNRSRAFGERVPSARRGLLALALLGATITPGCIVEPELTPGLQTFRVKVLTVNGGDPPTADAPLPANTGTTIETLEIDVQAVSDTGDKLDFDGTVRLSIEPGAVVQVYDAEGRPQARNLRIKNGRAKARVEVSAVYGPARLLVEDLGYRPADVGETPACANGENDDPDEDVFVDYPSDPGCAFADDDIEESGSYAAGSSPPLQFALPTLRQIQGAGSETPYAFEGLEVKADAPQVLVVTRIAKDGFYVTDLADQEAGHNHLFAFSFSTPPGLRVCDRVTYLSGTMAEFFGFTEMNFPSYEAEPVFEDVDCLVPEPVVLDGEGFEEADILLGPGKDRELEKQESGLVRVRDYVVAELFGSKLATGNKFEADRSNCDLNGDGRIDFEDEAEASCSNTCNALPECSEWTQYATRGSYKIHRGAKVIMAQTDGAPEFTPQLHRGAVLTALTGSLRNFSGGSLNWTIEARCPDDLVCAERGCSEEIKPSSQACVSLRTEDDNDEGTN